MFSLLYDRDNISVILVTGYRKMNTSYTEYPSFALNDNHNGDSSLSENDNDTENSDDPRNGAKWFSTQEVQSDGYSRGGRAWG